MKIRNVEYILSAVKENHFLSPDRPEVVMSGRSNVGKSSLLNLLTGRTGVAKVSKTPGKTRAVNFFDVDGAWRIVDLPGYGYARLSKKEIEQWGGLIDTYLRDRKNIAVIVQLIDSRHAPTRLDLEMMEWLAQTQTPTLIALTKTDKLGKNDRRTAAEKFRKEWIPDLDWPLVATSVKDKVGRKELMEAIEGFIEKLDLPTPPPAPIPTVEDPKAEASGFEEVSDPDTGTENPERGRSRTGPTGRRSRSRRGPERAPRKETGKRPGPRKGAEAPARKPKRASSDKDSRPPRRNGETPRRGANASRTASKNRTSGAPRKSEGRSPRKGGGKRR